MRILLGILLILVLPITANATIYMQTDEAGNTTYSDIPLSKQAQPIEITKKEQAASTVSAPATTHAEVKTTKKTTVTTEEISEENIPYRSFEITFPKNHGTIQNQQNFAVTFQIDPKLQKGDSIQLMLDGKLYGSPQAKDSIDLTNMERGAHHLSALLLDKNKQVIKQSNTVLFYLHLPSVNSPVYRANPPTT